MASFESVVRDRKGHGWYESEVDPDIVGHYVGHKIGRRSYEMCAHDYKEFLKWTRMDMCYVYTPWMWGRDNRIDEKGRFQYVRGTAEVGDIPPAPDLDQWRRRIEDLADLNLEVAILNTPQLAMDALGMEKFLLALYDDRLGDWLERIDERVVKITEVVASYPVTAIQITQAMADKNGQLMSDEHMERFMWPYLERRSEQIDTQLLAVHCDGDCSKLYPRFNRIGVNLFNGYEGPSLEKDCQEPFVIRGCVPVDLLQRGTPKEVWDKVLECKSFGSLIVGSTHDSNNVPIDNFRAMMVAALE